MGRLPATYADRPIGDRIPYTFSGELVLGASATLQFPEGTFSNSTDKPFEIHRVIPRVAALDENEILLNPQPDWELLANLVRLSFESSSRTDRLSKQATLIANLVKGSSERSWEFADPYTLPKSDSITVVAQTLAFPANDPIANLDVLRVQVTFQGFQVVIAPAMGNR